MPVAKAALLLLYGRGKRRQEQTTTANVGAYTAPLGAPLRQPFPNGEDEEELLRRLEAELRRLSR